MEMRKSALYRAVRGIRCSVVPLGDGSCVNIWAADLVPVVEALARAGIAHSINRDGSLTVCREV